MPSRSPQIFSTLSFLLLLSAAGITQAIVDAQQGIRPQALDLFRRPPTQTNLRSYEAALEDESWLAQLTRPWMQYLQFLTLGDLGDKALLGRQGWCFYRPGVDYVTQRPPSHPPPSDPLPAILHFRDQLAARNIALLILPVPNKESVHPAQLVRRARGRSLGPSHETQSLLERLRQNHVEVVDLLAHYSPESLQFGEPQDWYLTQDSHWSPAGLQMAAQVVAAQILSHGWINHNHTTYDLQPRMLSRRGDVLQMLASPSLQALFAPETISTLQVVHRKSQELYADDPASQVLVLGDSFLRIFQSDEPGAAGFLAHLARELGQPVASIVNDGGASTLVRQELHRRPSLLDRKRVVVWEFVERDIRFGAEGWQLIALPNPSPKTPTPSTQSTNPRG